MIMSKRLQPFALLGLVLLVGLLMAVRDRSPSSVEGIRQQGELVIAVREGPTSHYTNSFGPVGFELELAQAFAQELGVQLRVLEVTNEQQALDLVMAGKADIAVGVAQTENRRQPYALAVPVQTVSQHVVCEGSTRPANVAALADRALVIADGNHHDEQLQKLHLAVPALTWQALPDAGTENLLGFVHQDQADCAIVNANEWAFHRHLYPDLRIAFDLPGNTFFGWILAPNTQNTSLRDAANAFVARRQADGTIAALRERHYAHVQSLTHLDGKNFYRAIRQRLPRYVDTFRAEAERNNLDWRLLAAVAYQESMWDSAAQSPTGVKGLMQLTFNTATEMGIADRTDPHASIRGGARYLRQILDTLPASIPETDRTWMALAAYNAGLAHILDARELTRKRGGNPDSWPDVRGNLALLKQAQWYSQTRYGYARGATQAIIYVRHVRRYYDLLVLASNSRGHDDMMLAMGGVTGMVVVAAN